MPLLIDRSDTQRFVGLFVGNHHSGKTVAEASFPKPSFFFDFDLRIGGAQVPWLDLRGIEYEAYPPKTPNLIQKLDDRIEIWISQAQLQTGGAGNLAVFGQLPKTICLDSLTWMTFAFTCQSVGITHRVKNEDGRERKAGRWLGPVAMLGPEDYGLEAQATYGILANLKSLPVQNIILSAHLIDTYEKPKDEEGNELPYAASIINGQKLSVRDKIGVNMQAAVDHVFHFERETIGNADHFYCTFRGGIACSAYSWLPFGRIEWSGKNFYDLMLSYKTKALASNLK